MSLDHLLLGALREPASGYDLKAQFDAAFRYFWPAELSQIYRTLRRLEDEGLLASRAAPSEKGPERRVYRITKRGRTALRRWLAAGPSVGDDRHAYVAQAFFLDELANPDAQEDFFRALHDEFTARHAALEATAKEWAAEDAGYPDRLPEAERFRQFTLELGIAKTETIARWAASCLDRLTAGRTK